MVDSEKGCPTQAVALVAVHAHPRSMIVSRARQILPRSWRGWAIVVAAIVVLALLAVGFDTKWSSTTLTVIGIVAVLPTGLAVLAQVPSRAIRSREALTEKMVSASEPTAAAQIRPTVAGNEAAAWEWDTALNPVVAALASALPDARTVLTIAAESGIPLAEIDPDGALYDRWHVVVRQASRRGERTIDLALNLALARAPDPALRRTIDEYWHQR